jgi:hypothetical protein
MLEIAVSDEFARWFEGLAEDAAERVTGALEVVRALGPGLDPVQQSAFLLWYDGLGGAPAEPAQSAAGLGLEFLPHRRREAWLDRYSALLTLHREALRCLESPEFAAALQNLDGPTASQALDVVRGIRHNLRATQFDLSAELARSLGGAPGAAFQLGLGPARLAWRLGEEVARLQRELERALRFVGLQVSDVVDQNGGLRELTVEELRPKLRVIYGLDIQHRRLIALVGDALTRPYYGDSVRLAEQRWREYRWGDRLKARAPVAG